MTKYVPTISPIIDQQLVQYLVEYLVQYWSNYQIHGPNLIQYLTPTFSHHHLASPWWKCTFHIWTERKPNLFDFCTFRGVFHFSGWSKQLCISERELPNCWLFSKHFLNRENSVNNMDISQVLFANFHIKTFRQLFYSPTGKSKMILIGVTKEEWYI